MLKHLLFITSCLFLNSSFAADTLDTQYGPDGLEVYVKRISSNHNIITVVFELKNSSDERMEYFSIPIKQVYYTTKDRKYPVLRDIHHKWLASTIGYTSSDINLFSNREDFSKTFIFKLNPNQTKMGWLKFEAPRKSDWPLEITMPGITPFSINKPE